MRVADIVLNCRLSQAMQIASDYTFCFFLPHSQKLRLLIKKDTVLQHCRQNCERLTEGYLRPASFYPSSHHSTLLKRTRLVAPVLS
jgi:hypothetical protein